MLGRRAHNPGIQLIAMATNQWTEFRQNGLAFRGKLFTPLDVDPDGDCFYHSVVASHVLPIPTASLLRQQLVSNIFGLYQHTDWAAIIDKIYASYNKRCGFHAYLQGLLQPGNWGTDLEMVFIYLAFGVNVVSITNTPFGLAAFCAKSYIDVLHITMPSSFAEASPAPIHLYHHAYGRPLMSTHAGNHFCVLFEVADISMKEALFEKAFKGSGARMPQSTNVLTVSDDDVDDEIAPVKNKKRLTARSAAIQVAKHKKQKTLVDWLPNVAPATKEQVESLEAELRCRKELDNVGSNIVIETFLSSKAFQDDRTDGSPNFQKAPSSTYQIRDQQKRQEFTWHTKSIYIYFHLHPMFANQDFDVTCAVFDLNRRRENAFKSGLDWWNL